MIEFRRVEVSYDERTPILKGIDLSIREGEFVAFVGTNGAGKSTTMRLINGLLKPDSGEVLIEGTPTTQLRTSDLAQRVGFLFQNPDRQICCPTVREELLFGFKAIGREDDEAERRVDEAIERFGFDGSADPFLLNRGTRQLLALASIVILAPPVIVLDEPTTGLDFRECVKVMEIITRLHRAGTTVIMVCHDMEVVADFAERVIVMSDGRVIDEGPTFDVLRRRRVLEEASLVPPQIMDLSLALSLMDPDLKATPIASANTLNEMQMAIEATAEHAPADGIITVSVAETSSGAPGAQELESVLTTAAEGAER
jgi:energy-coupling factor transport system ATP-binding protein